MNTLDTIIKQHRPHTFLLDASGVLYNDNGPTPNIDTTVAQLQRIGHVIVVTNNSNNYVQEISEKFKKNNIHIAAEHIISSGHGLEDDATINRLIRNKTCFIFGRDKSIPYIKNAGGQPSQDINSSDCIIITASVKEKTQELFERTVTHAIKNPDIPVICCNPDRVVLGPNKRVIYVAGHWAEKVETAIGRPIHWIGKPHSNFSQVVKTRLATLNITPDNGVLFFDDNSDNVKTMVQDLGISGYWVTDTGINAAIDGPSLPDWPFKIPRLRF